MNPSEIPPVQPPTAGITPPTALQPKNNFLANGANQARDVSWGQLPFRGLMLAASVATISALVLLSTPVGWAALGLIGVALVVLAIRHALVDKPETLKEFAAGVATFAWPVTIAVAILVWVVILPLLDCLKDCWVSPGGDLGSDRGPSQPRQVERQPSEAAEKTEERTLTVADAQARVKEAEDFYTQAEKDYKAKWQKNQSLPDWEKELVEVPERDEAFKRLAAARIALRNAEAASKQPQPSAPPLDRGESTNQFNVQYPKEGVDVEPKQ